ncbi:hypothetical protein EFK50_05440 [Nocardioides marmoriginsengisoli]|uniref:Uncharacterized protein n=1 Tax=Nocardioides marmoriginsengisoli TaxID=661483 RepID=A0A3N0CPY0_9ACTN|nr:hypothetical protein [Nocardioides marmoriginsengisoli]RNL65399.1 hypothetical protein EFK50_05440 [Nocardioides marmoriginsengisoli]
MKMLPIYASLGVFAAAVIQMMVALSQLRDDEQDVIEHWGARDQLRTEVSWWRNPIQRWRRSRDIKQMIDAGEEPAFLRRFWRVRASVLSWMILVVASGYGALATLFD